MRARNIKPGFFCNETLADLEPLARILFIGLWCYADREGRFEWRPKRIKAAIFPYDNCDIETLLMSLHSAKFIYMYRHGEECFGYIPKFRDHQSPHPHEAKSKIPKHQEKTSENRCHDMQVTLHEMPLKCNADSLIPDSLIPDVMIADSTPAHGGSELFAEQMQELKTLYLNTCGLTSVFPSKRILEWLEKGTTAREIETALIQVSGYPINSRARIFIDLIEKPKVYESREDRVARANAELDALDLSSPRKMP